MSDLVQETSQLRSMLSRVLIALTWLISLSNIILNSFLIHALRKHRKLKTVSYWLISCLSVSDIFVGIFCLIKESLYLALSNRDDAHESKFLVVSVRSFWINFSTSFVLIIAVDRYIHMKYALRYHTLMTKKRAIISVIFNAIFTIHMTVTVRFLPKYQKEFLSKHALAYRIYRVILSIVYVIIILIVFLLYITTYVAIKKKIKEAPSLGRKSADNNENTTESGNQAPNICRNGKRSVDQEFAKAMGIVISILFLCLTPNLCIGVYERIVLLIRNGRYQQSNATLTARYWTFLMMQLNSSLNAIIIIVFSRELRHYSMRFLRNVVNGE